eukprot:CAMPEP_0115267140 /NCGR_PEP_ID=MMETSP0270-20121206/51836_1 /TAXON_ID=71861 /ORGANISM="Scrippsiella trochoidea, Strain CCMP3099" /LENGTH=276 /DNA_ID=CAMNT_0002683271 /DNA_START=57 /DNA_END=883 /DNA_ORIENTATION=-
MDTPPDISEDDFQFKRSSMLTSKAIERARRARESDWTAASNIGDMLVREYVEFAFTNSADWLRRLNERAQTVLETNAELQQQLSEQDMIVRSLQREQAASEARWKNVEAEMARRKGEHEQVEAQFRQMHAQRMSDECSLRDRGVGLHQRLASLSREKARLEELRRDEERQKVKLDDASTKLQQEMIALELRKSALEESSEADITSIGSTSQNALAPAFRMSRAVPSPMRLEEQSLLDQRSRTQKPGASSKPSDSHQPLGGSLDDSPAAPRPPARPR